MRSTIVVSLRSKGIPGFNKRAVLDVRQQAIAMAVEIADIFKAALTTFANLSWTAWIAIALTIITTGADFTIMPNKTDSSIFLVFFAFITLPLLAMTILVVQRRDTAHTRLGQAKAALVAISLQASTAWATAASVAASPQPQHASWGEHAAQAQSTMDVAADVRHSLAAVVDDLHRYLSHKRPNARHFLVPYKSSQPTPGNPLFQVSREMGVLLRKLHRSIRLLHLNTHQLQQAVTAQPSSHPGYAGTSPWPPQTSPWHPSPAQNHHRTSPSPLGPSPSLAPSPPLMPDPSRSLAQGNQAQPTPQLLHPDPSEHSTQGAGGVGSYQDTQGGMHSAAAAALMQGAPSGAAAGVEAVATQQGGAAAGGQPGAGPGLGPGQQGQWGGWVAEGAAGRGRAAGLSAGVDSGQLGPGQADEGGGQQWGGWGGWAGGGGAGGAGVVMGLLLGQHVVRLHEAVEALSTIKELRTPVLLRAVQRWFVVVLMPAFLAHFWMAAAKGLGAALAGTMGVLLQLSLMVLMDVAISLEDPFDEAALDGISCFEALDHIAAMTSEEGMEAEYFPALVPRSTAVPAYFMPRSWQSGGERPTPGQPPDNSGGEGTWWSKPKSRRRDDQADGRDDDVSGREAGTDYEHVFLDGYGSGVSRPTPAMPPMPPLPQAYSAAQDLGLVGSTFGGRPR